MSQNRCNPYSYCIKSSFIWVLKSNHITSESSNQMRRAEIDWLCPTVHVKDQVLVNVSSEGLFRTPSDRIFHRIHIVRTSCSQLPARSGIFYFFHAVVYWLCGLKFMYPTMKLAFLGIKVKLPAKFCLHSFEWFCLQISSDTKYYFLFCDRGLIVVKIYYFQIWNKKRTQHYYL